MPIALKDRCSLPTRRNSRAACNRTSAGTCNKCGLRACTKHAAFSKQLGFRCASCAAEVKS